MLGSGTRGGTPSTLIINVKANTVIIHISGLCFFTDEWVNQLGYGGRRLLRSWEERWRSWEGWWGVYGVWGGDYGTTDAFSSNIWALIYRWILFSWSITGSLQMKSHYSHADTSYKGFWEYYYW